MLLTNHICVFPAVILRMAGTAATGRFTEEEDDEELVRDLFDSIDTDDNKSISKEELHAALSKFRGDSALATVLEDLLSKSEALAQGISFEMFLKAFRELPRVRGERVRFAATLRLEEMLARHLVKGHVFDGLKGLKELTDEEVEKHVQEVCSKFSAVLPDTLRQSLAELRAGQGKRTAAQHHMNSKFVMEGAYVGNFASLNEFYKGPEALIGVPNPKIFEGAEKEHTLRANAWMKYRTSNYGLVTCPGLEWYFVIDPFGSNLDPNWLENAKYPHTPKEKKLWKQEESKAWLVELLKNKPTASQGPANQAAESEGWKGDYGREPVLIDEFLLTVEVKRAGLRREECICLRLYTGPMFVLYNASLRGFPATDVAALAGNKFETTIFAIASGVTKLSKITGIPSNKRLYRGLGGMVLPEHFWREFSECVVVFYVTAEDLERIKAALGSKVEEHDALRGKDRALKTKMLRLENGWSGEKSGVSLGSGPGQTAADGLVRVVTEARVAGDAVRMTVALPFSKFDFTDEKQTLFRDAVSAACGGGVQVVVEEVADKPADFKGGGVSSILFPLHKAHYYFSWLTPYKNMLAHIMNKPQTSYPPSVQTWH